MNNFRKLFKSKKEVDLEKQILQLTDRMRCIINYRMDGGIYVGMIVRGLQYSDITSIKPPNEYDYDKS